VIFADAERHRRRLLLARDHEDGQYRRAGGSIVAVAVVDETHVSADVADRLPRRVIDDLPAPFAQGVATAPGSGRQGELSVVHVELMDGVGTPVVGLPRMLDDEASELQVVGLVDEPFRRRGVGR